MAARVSRTRYGGGGRGRWSRTGPPAYTGAMKLFLVDTLTSVVFFTVVAASTELLIAGLSPAEVALTRAVMVPIMIATARPYGMWRDLLLRRAGAGSAALRAAVDTAAFLSFQVPLYAATLVVAGADGAEIAAAIASASAFMLVLGRPFGLVLDTVRRMAGIVPPSAAPHTPEREGDVS